MEKVSKINTVIKAYFDLNKSIKIIPAKDLMPQFIKAGIFPSDHKNGLPIRNVLRDLDKKNELSLIPYTVAERKMKNTNWFFQNESNPSILEVSKKEKSNPGKLTANKKLNKNRDEDYVIDLCDEVLKLKGSRQHRFEFLLADPGKNGRRAKLPVDVYYPYLSLVVEFKEVQHSKSVKHFDKPDKLTISGVHRGEQRKKYDALRVTELPKHGIQLIEISYEVFDCGRNNRIIRNIEKDRQVLRRILKNLI